MGGKALSQYGVLTERKDTISFNEIGNYIRDRLFTDLELETAVVRCYHTKADHGDLDLLIKITGEFNKKNINFRDYITKTFKPNAIHNGGGVYSFDYDNFQIDFIPIRESNWEIAQTYFSYDPLGNIMGKTYHKFNLSYGWEGLYYKFRNFNGRNSHNILISKDPKKIFEFGDYDYNRYLNGFDNLEEIFIFVINTRYFDANIFKMENLRHIDKKRNRKRKSYNVFLNYLQENNVTTKFDFNKDKSVYIPLIDSYFPEAELITKLKKLEEKDNLNKALSMKFNGNIIMTWTDLKGKELGNAIKKFKLALGDNYNDFILNNDENTIRDYFTLINHEEN